MIADAHLLKQFTTISSVGCAISRDGTRAVSLGQSRDGVLRLLRVCDLQDGKLLAEIDIQAHVSQTAISPDGKQAALITTGGGIEVWDIPAGKTGRKLTVPPFLPRPLGRGLRLSQLFFTPDNRRLILVRSGLEQSEVLLWELNGRPEPNSRTLLKASVGAVTPTQDGKALLCGLGSGRIATLALPNLKSAEWELPLAPMAAPRGRGDAVGALLCGPNNLLAAACLDGEGKKVVLLWDLVGNYELRRWESDFDPSNLSMAFAHDSRQLAVGLRYGSLDIYSPPTGERFRIERVHLDEVAEPAWNRQGRLLSIGRRIPALKVWELSEPSARWTVRPDSESVADIAVSPDVRRLAGKGGQDEPHIWVIPLGEHGTAHSFPLPSHAGRGGELFFRRDGKQLAWVEGRLAVGWDVESGEELWRIEPRGPGLFWEHAAWDAEGRLLVVTWSFGNGLTVSDVLTGKTIQRGMQTHGPARGRLSRDGRLVIAEPAPSPLPQKFVTIWEVKSGKRIAEVPIGTEDKLCALLPLASPEGRWLLLTHTPLTDAGLGPATEAVLGLIDTKTMQTVLRFRSAVLPRGVAVSPDGRLLAVGFSDGSIQVWDLPGKETLFRWAASANPIREVAFSEDSEWLVGSAENEAEVQLVRLGALQRRLEAINPH